MMPRTLGLGAALVLAGVLLPAHASAAGVTLRYRFADGETITYRMNGASKVTGSEGGKAFPVGTDTQSYLVHYAFSHIAEGGGALLTMKTDRIVDHFTQSGKTRSSTTPASTQQFLQEPDGRQYSSDLRFFGAYSNGDLGSLPGGSVSVGSTWQSTLTDRGPIFKPNTTVMCTNTLTAFEPGSNRVAVIDTSCGIHGHGQVTDHGRVLRFAAADTLSGRWRFAVTSGRFLSQVLHETTTETGTVTDKKGTRPFKQSVTQTLTQQLVSTAPPASSGPGTSV